MSILGAKIAMQASMIEEMVKKHPEYEGMTFDEILASFPPRNKKNPLFADGFAQWDGITIVEHEEKK